LFFSIETPPIFIDANVVIIWKYYKIIFGPARYCFAKEKGRSIPAFLNIFE